jgi:protease PrsW
MTTPSSTPAGSVPTGYLPAGTPAPSPGSGPGAPPSDGARLPQVVQTRRGFTNTWLFAGLVVSLFAVGLAFMLLFIGAHTGLTNLAWGVVFAVLPLGLVVPAFLWIDRFEPEPKLLLLTCFGWGACVATGVALGGNTLFDKIVTSSGGGSTLTAVISAPIVEESAKAAIVFLVFWFRRKDFDGVVDGIVLAGLSAAGFAATENILYLARAHMGAETTGLVSVFILRGLVAPFTHPLFTAFTGIGIGVAAVTHRRWLKITAPIAGLLLAMGMHALWNGSATTGWFLLVFPLFEVPLFVGAVIAVIVMRRHEGQLIGRFLWDYVPSGWFSPGEVWMLAAMPRRKQARRWSKRVGGKDGLNAMRAFQNSASDLALLRARVARGTAGDDLAEVQWGLLQNVNAARDSFTLQQRRQGTPLPAGPPPGQYAQVRSEPGYGGYALPATVPRAHPATAAPPIRGLQPGQPGPDFDPPA